MAKKPQGLPSFRPDRLDTVGPVSCPEAGTGRLTGWTAKPFLPVSLTGPIPPPTRSSTRGHVSSPTSTITAIALVGALYDELGIEGEVLDLMGSWVSHFRTRPARLTVLGMNAEELAANPFAAATVVHDLNADPRLPFADESFDAVVCCVSVDYLTRPIEVFRDVARVVRPGGAYACTFSNRCFPTKAIRGWLSTTDEQHCQLVQTYFRLAGGWTEPCSERRTPPFHPGDPLFAVWARRQVPDPGDAP